MSRINFWAFNDGVSKWCSNEEAPAGLVLGTSHALTS